MVGQTGAKQNSNHIVIENKAVVIWKIIKTPSLKHWGTLLRIQLNITFLDVTNYIQYFDDKIHKHKLRFFF